MWKLEKPYHLHVLSKECLTQTLKKVIPLLEEQVLENKLEWWSEEKNLANFYFIFSSFILKFLYF